MMAGIVIAPLPFRVGAGGEACREKPALADYSLRSNLSPEGKGLS